jgi:hypothetical protein
MILPDDAQPREMLTREILVVFFYHTGAAMAIEKTPLFVENIYYQRLSAVAIRFLAISK